jgi:hypothetical protein
MSGRQISDCSFDGIVPEWYRYTGAGAKYWFFGQDKVPSLDVSGRECTFALLRGCRGINAEERRIRVILEVKICKITFEATGDVRRWPERRRAFGVCDSLQLFSTERRIAFAVNEHLNV